jgi:colicin import membrane protein
MAARADKAETDRDAARLEAGTAREDAARWRGQAEALQARPAALPAERRPRRNTGGARKASTPEKGEP